MIKVKFISNKYWPQFFRTLFSDGAHQNLSPRWGFFGAGISRWFAALTGGATIISPRWGFLRNGISDKEKGQRPDIFVAPSVRAGMNGQHAQPKPHRGETTPLPRDCVACAKHLFLDTYHAIQSRGSGNGKVSFPKTLLIVLLANCLIVSLSNAQILPNFGGERAGLSALSFLKNDMNPRSAGLGGSSVSLSGDAYSVLTNPAALTDVENCTYLLTHQFIGAGIHQSLAGVSIPLKDEVSNLAFSINALNSGAMEERTEFQPEGTGRQVFVSNIAFGATYARKLSERFSAGVTLKYIYEGIANFTNHNATVDVAFLYRTDFKDLQFAVMIQNFGGNSSLGAEDDIPVVFNRELGVDLDANTVPTVFSLGASIVPWQAENQSLLFSAQLNHPNDNAENFRIGAEYEYLEMFYGRAGYKFSVRGQSWPTIGIGVRTRAGGWPLNIDYAVNPTNHLGLQHTLGLRISVLKVENR